ncbi:unnamed protein product [Blepharisma stoltei]|uniref:MARVEL domain-containing protein n=1 Tax=Blepharisma stoltei TaxID=1481888 RepID=A0AAU9J308_9CILI|nr:unnamed protein product [Blepharisma stoltei]
MLPEAQNNQNPGLFHAEIERTQKAIYWMSAILVILLIIFAEIGCIYRTICHTSEDIDIPAYVSHIFFPVLVITLAMTVLGYESAEVIYHDCLKPLRFVMIIWAILVIVLSVAEWIAGMVISGSSDRTDKWNELTPLSQKYYDNDVDNLNEDYRINMSIVCIFQIVAAVILLAIGISIWILYSKAPSGYLPRPIYEKLKDNLAQPVNQMGNPLIQPPEFAPQQENPLLRASDANNPEFNQQRYQNPSQDFRPQSPQEYDQQRYQSPLERSPNQFNQEIEMQRYQSPLERSPNQFPQENEMRGYQTPPQQRYGDYNQRNPLEPSQDQGSYNY